MKTASLDQVLYYSNPDVVDRFVKNTKIDPMSAQEIFTETLKLLWLMHTQKRELHLQTISEPKQITVFHQMSVIDEMWHTFILFTKDYSTFCTDYFGQYLHHAPTTERENHAEQKLDQASRAKTTKVLCHYIAEKLGPQTLTRWFKEYPTRFRLQP